MDVVCVICQFCAEINDTLSQYRNQFCDLNEYSHYRELKTPDEIQAIINSEVPEQFLKQRSPEWFKLRKAVNVTGSVAHRALGLDSLVGQNSTSKPFFIFI